MATYIQGVQDRVEALRPPKQNLQQNASMLQTLQSRYDKNHDALSQKYGTILNAGLTRENNIQAREDFFKLIDSDIQKVANLDLSKRSEQEKASGVFSQIYDNQYLVKDMVWTKNFQQEMKRAEAFKNCVDPEECGGQYWEEGVKYMQYKRQEFASTDDADSLTFSNAEYVPYNNVMDKALKQFKEMGGYDMQGPPTLSPDGKYWVTTKNGKQSIKPLTAMFSKLYKDNPQLNKQFEVIAHNQRKDWAAGQVQAGNFGSIAEAEVGYIKKQAETLNNKVIELSESIGADDEVIDKKLKALDAKYKNGKMLEGSAEAKQYVELQALKQMSGRAKAFTETAKTAMKNANNHRVVRNIGSQLDQAAGMVLLDQEIGQAAGILAYKDYEVSIEADDFAKMKTKHQYDISLEGFKQSNRMKMEQFKIDNKHSSYADKNKPTLSVGKNIEADFKQRFDAGEISDLKKQAEEKYPDVYSKTEMEKEGSLDDEKERPRRLEMLEQNKEVEAKRQDWMRQQKAKKLDDKYGTNYSSQLSVYGSDGVYGASSESASGEVMGGLDQGVVSGGAKSGAYSYKGSEYKKDDGQWYKKVNGSYKRLAQGNVAARTATLEKNARRTGNAPERTFADFTFTADNINSKHIDFLAKNSNPVTSEYFSSFQENAKKQGLSASEYLKTKPKAEQEKILKTFGLRMDQAAYAATGKNKWVKTNRTKLDEDKVNHAGEDLQKGIKPNLDGKRKIAQTISSEYIEQLSEDSDEFKDMQKTVESMLLKYGEVNGSTLTYNGESIGLVYYQPDKNIKDETYHLFKGGVGTTYGAYTSKQGKDGKYHRSKSGYQSLKDRGMKLIVPGRTHMIDKKMMKKIINNESGGGFADVLYKHKIKGAISGTENDYFKSDEHKKSTRAYDEFDSTVGIYSKAKKENKAEIIKTMNGNMGASEYFQDFKDQSGESLYVAEDFIDDNGNWSPNLNTTNSSTRLKAYNAYMDATDQVYAEKTEGDYKPGLGNRYYNEMALQRPDLTTTDQESSSWDVRNYLKKVIESDIKSDAAFRINDRTQYDHADKDKIINQMLNGDIEIESVYYTPIGGSATTDAVKKQLKGDWQRMEVVTADGKKYDFDLYSSMHNTSLYNNSIASPKTHALNAAGSYNAVDPHIVTNEQPITIRKTGRNTLEVVGELYRWDETQGRVYYDNISDVLTRTGEDLSGYTPEQVESLLAPYMEKALKSYQNHTPVVK